MPAARTAAAGARRAKPARRPLRVLFIGNSYTYFHDLPRMFQRLSAAAQPPRPVEVRAVAPGGCTLERHWNKTPARKAIAEGKWDYVVLQDHSLGPVQRPEVMKTHARLFDQEIRKAGAKTVFFLTWARQHKPAMQVALTREYTAIARELKARLAPVGEAWKAALGKNPKYALHVRDRSHPNPRGTYLAACVFFATIHGRSPEGLPGRIVVQVKDADGRNAQKVLASLRKDSAAFLQKIAWQTVTAGKAYLPVGAPAPPPAPRARRR
jgi:hypothetical protein